MLLTTLDSGIDVGPGKFVKKNKPILELTHYKSTFTLFDKAVGPGKKFKLINVGPTSIPESRVKSKPECLK